MIEGVENPLLASQNASLTFNADFLANFVTTLAAIFQDSPDCVAIYAPDTNVIYANKSLENTWGYSLEHAQARQDLSPEGYKPYRDALQSVLTTGAPVSFLFECPLSSMRRQINDLISMTAIKNSSQSILGVIAIGRNLDDYKHNQYQALAQKERYQRALIDTFPFMVWLKDIDSRFLAINNAFAKLIGVTHSDDAIGKSDYDYFPSSAADSYVGRDKEVILTALPNISVEIIHNETGEMHWAEVYKSPVLIDGKAIGTVGFARDLSEFKKLQADISQTKSEYIALIENLPLGIMRYDLGYKCIFMSAYCERLSGLPVERMLGKLPAEFFHMPHLSSGAEEIEQRFDQVLQSGNPQLFEMYNDMQGQQMALLIRIVPEFNVHKKVTGMMMLASDISELSEYREQVEYMAYHDALTKLPNRTMFNKRLISVLANSRRQQQLFGVLMIDLDHFKSINDTLGHSVGDELLIEAAGRIVNALRSGDSIARLGGDEFAVLIQDVIHIEDLGRLAAKIVQALALPFYVAGQELFVTASIGIAAYPQDTKNVDDLLRYADVAMYAAKKQGRNNYQYFVPELNQNISQRLQLQTELMHAIEKEEFYLNYQPLVYLASGEIIGVEALLRWNNATLGEVYPDEFIPLAEELGVITEIGRWVMMRAFEDAASVNLKREKPLMFAVNLSARQFLRYDIFAAVQYCLSLTNCNPAWITLEITESLLLNDSEQVLATLDNFAALGIKIAIDDFGTGYSSLSYLNKFPISEVKIDRSFVSDITLDENDAKLVKAVIGMALSLGKELIAEGVETQAQADLLKSWGCNIGQGYLFSKPLSFKQLLLTLK